MLRDADTDLLRRHLSHRVRFIENEKLIGEKEPALAFLLCIWRAEQDEKQRVIQHNQVRSQQTFARLLIETARILAAGFLGADMRFAANLRPDFWIGLH